MRSANAHRCSDDEFIPGGNFGFKRERRTESYARSYPQHPSWLNSLDGEQFNAARFRTARELCCPACALSESGFYHVTVRVSGATETKAKRQRSSDEPPDLKGD
jgi:hypothetical protein